MLSRFIPCHRFRGFSGRFLYGLGSDRFFDGFRRHRFLLFALLVGGRFSAGLGRIIEFRRIAGTLRAEVGNVLALDALVIVSDTDALEVEPRKER